jgi:hypothetical protein
MAEGQGAREWQAYVIARILCGAGQAVVFPGACPREGGDRRAFLFTLTKCEGTVVGQFQ